MRMNGLMTKNELRSVMRVRNRQLSPEERLAAAERIFAAVEMLPAFGRARCVACFCALPDEPPTEAVLRRWSAVRRIVVPRVEGDAMRFYDYRPSALTSGAFGIAEPVVEDCPVCPPEAIDLMLVPGMAFTREGARLGRGKGFYDRYMAQPELQAFRVGVCFAHQLVETLPTEPHDCAIDAVCFG